MFKLACEVLEDSILVSRMSESLQPCLCLMAPQDAYFISESVSFNHVLAEENSLWNNHGDLGTLSTDHSKIYTSLSFIFGIREPSIKRSG